MTIISFEHRFIFVKTRKVAGTSVEAYLRQFADQGDIVTPLVPRDEQWCVERGLQSHNYSSSRELETRYMELSRLGEFEAAMELLKEMPRQFVNHMPAAKIKLILERRGYRWEDFYSFTIDRHPYSWLLSVLLYNNEAYHAEGRLTLDLADINKRAIEFINSESFAGRLNSSLYAQAGTLLVNEVLHYERLQDDLSRVLTPLIGEPDLSTLPFLKKNASHLSPLDVFEPDVLELIRQKMRDACDLAGYQF